jgi:GH15 family glucan-1,4-alpha-glucosidase
MAGRRLPQPQSISRLTSPHDSLLSKCWRLRHAEFQPHHGRHLRKADDPCILDSLKAVDHLLKTDTPNGPVWHRYNSDGYGEHDDGSAFDGTGRGRGWPLLTGERGHYALSAGEDVLPYLESMMAMSSPLGLIPEQVWDSDPIVEHDLKPGKPSGSAMPLVWAHSEFGNWAISGLIANLRKMALLTHYRTR